MRYKWLLDAGHGGILNGKYVTAPKKMWRFDDGMEVYEGVINRQITSKLITLLRDEKIDFGLVYDEIVDTPLAERVAIANRVYAKNPNTIYLSIHSNAGGGKGFEVYTGPGQTVSDKFGEVFYRGYLESFKSTFKIRIDLSDGDGDKESPFYVLEKTKCPAILVENLFFDNREEALYLLSDAGQHAIAACMFAAIVECENIKLI